MEKRLEFKQTKKPMSNTCGFSVHSQIGQRRCGTTICGRTCNNIEGCKRGRST